MTEPAAPNRTEPVLDSVTRADPSDELATTTLLRAAIGTVNTDYYLAIFTRFDAQDKTGPCWNTAAALTTLNWMLFRRMWNAALAYTGIALTVALLVFGIGKLALHYSAEVQWALAGLYALALVAIPGLFGNAMLFKQYRRDMARALSAHQALADAVAMLAAHAPSRQRLMVLGGINLLAAAAMAAVVQWASGFNGLPTGLGAQSPSAPATVTVTVTGGNIAAGRAVEASTMVAASAPALPAAAASTPQTTASAPHTAASAAQAPASAPTVAASGITAVTLPAPNAGRGSVQPAPASAHAPQASPPTPSEPAAPAATAPRKTPATAAQPRPKPVANAATSHFVINVGLFADDNNARNALVKLKDAGLAAYTQEMRGKKGKLTWVRVGPFDAMAQAEKAMENIHALGLDAQVVKQPQ